MLFFFIERDLIPAFVTFLACLFVGVELGILIGTIFDLAILLYLNARPTINIEHRNVRKRNCVFQLGYLAVKKTILCIRNHKEFKISSQISTIDYFLVHPTTGILFPAVDHLRTYLTKNPGINVVLDCERIDKIDFTAAQVSK